MGIPAFRLMLEDRIAIDILPQGVSAVAVTLGDAAEKIAGGGTPKRLNWDRVLADPPMNLWQNLLFGDIPSAVDNPGGLHSAENRKEMKAS